LRAIDLAKNELTLHNYSCVVVHEDSVIMTSFESGVRPLIHYYENKSRNFSNAVLADKVIGRAAAFLVVLCGITSVYAEVMSIDAKEYSRSIIYTSSMTTWCRLLPIGSGTAGALWRNCPRV